MLLLFLLAMALYTPLHRTNKLRHSTREGNMWTEEKPPSLENLRPLWHAYYIALLRTVGDRKRKSQGPLTLSPPKANLTKPRKLLNPELSNRT